MARKNDAAFDAFLADLKAINPAIEEIVRDDRVAAKLKEGVLARSDYSAQMDALAQERQQMQQYLAKENEKIQGWQTWYGDANREYNEAVNKLRQYESEYGPIEGGNGKPRLTQDEVAKLMEAEFQKRENAYLKFTTDLNRITATHVSKYREPVDVDALYKIAGEKNCSLDLAYKEFISEREEQDRNKDLEERIKAAKEEGAREALSRHKLPNLDSSPAFTHTLDAQAVGATTADRIRAATEAFMKK